MTSGVSSIILFVSKHIVFHLGKSNPNRFDFLDILLR